MSSGSSIAVSLRSAASNGLSSFSEVNSALNSSIVKDMSMVFTSLLARIVWIVSTEAGRWPAAPATSRCVVVIVPSHLLPPTSSPGKCSKPCPRGDLCKVTSLATPPGTGARSGLQEFPGDLQRDVLCPHLWERLPLIITFYYYNRNRDMWQVRSVMITLYVSLFNSGLCSPHGITMESVSCSITMSGVSSQRLVCMSSQKARRKMSVASTFTVPAGGAANS
jgi:hypothetical protein